MSYCDNQGYWDNKGKYQKEYEELWKHIPAFGEVKDDEKRFLEFLRMFSKIYYRYFNDGESPGNDEDYEDEFEIIFSNLTKFVPFMDDFLKRHIRNHDFGRVAMFPWPWTPRTLNLFMDAVILFSLDREKKMNEKSEKAGRSIEEKNKEKDKLSLPRSQVGKKTKANLEKKTRKKRKLKLKSLKFF